MTCFYRGIFVQNCWNPSPCAQTRLPAMQIRLLCNFEHDIFVYVGDFGPKWRTPILAVRSNIYCIHIYFEDGLFTRIRKDGSQVVGGRNLYLSTNSYWMNCVDSYSCSCCNVVWVGSCQALPNKLICLLAVCSFVVKNRKNKKLFYCHQKVETAKSKS